MQTPRNKFQLQEQTVYVLVQLVYAYGFTIQDFIDVFSDEELALRTCADYNANNPTNDKYEVRAVKMHLF